MSQIWIRVQERLKEEIEKLSYTTWIENTFAAIDDDVLTVYCDNELQRDWLEKQYKDIIFHTVKIISGQTYDIHFEVQVRDSSMVYTEEYLETIDTLKKNVEELEKTIKELEGRLSRLEKNNFTS